MNTSVTLTAEAFTQIHNALCFAESKGLEATVDAIRAALKDAYAQEERDFDQKFQHYDSVRARLGLSSIWSMYEIADLDQRHPYPSDMFVVYHDHWGENKSTHYPVCGPNWTDIYLAADRAIRGSGDSHHIFIEGFRPKNGNELHLVTGS